MSWPARPDHPSQQSRPPKRSGKMPWMIGVLVIGQSPRPDLMREFHRILPTSTKIALRGALDGLSDEQISRLAPTCAADTLFTVLPNGRGVKVSHQAVVERTRSIVWTLQHEGCKLIALCCTGEFVELADLPILFASRLHTQLAVAIGTNRRLGVYVPLAEQQAPAEQRWRACGFRHPYVVALSPKASAGEIETAASSMAAAQPELVVYDCMAYDSALRARADSVTNLPSILSISLLARVMAELVDASPDPAEIT